MAVDPELERLLPAEFLRLGLRTHAGFDTLARDAGRPRDTIIAGLSRITSQCVTCHATYRIERR
jgi:cytochrome c556